MKKRILSIGILFVLCLSLFVPQVAAKGKNILPEGSFDSAEDIKRIRCTQVSNVVEWSKEGATKTPGSYKHSPASKSRYVYWDVMTLAGETYDISFYAKNKGVASDFNIVTVFFDTDNGNATPFKNIPISSKWQKYEFTWTPPEKANNGNPVSGPTSFCIRLNTSETTDTLWLDEISIVPHGKVDAAYTAKPYMDNWKDPLPKERQNETVEFSDCINHWANNNLKALATSGYVNGYGDGIFLPDSNVTRAEFVTMITNTFDIADVSYNGAYTDVDKTVYYAKAVQLAYSLKIINPAMTVGNKFKPNQPITREEAATILLRACKLYENGKANEKNVEFSDENEISAWAKKEVKEAADYGLILGKGNGEFSPTDTITRAEAATLLLRLIEQDSRLAVYVDAQNGNDNNKGTAEAPLKTIKKAQELVRQGSKNMEHHIFVFLKSGEHYIDETLEFTPEDSGKNGYNVIYTSYGEGEASLMMGQHFGGFGLYNKSKNIYRTYVGNIDSRHVYIDGVKATRARSEGHHGLTDATKTETGYTTTDTFIAKFKHPEDLEFVYYDHWTQSRGQVDRVSLDGDVLNITMEPEWWHDATNRASSSVTLPEWYENAYELLDNPGEWYLNKYDGYLYYIPRPFENPDQMVATIPVGERMMNIKGDSADDVIHNIEFDNVCFEYTTWLRPNTKGVAESQNNLYREVEEDGNIIEPDMPDTAIYVSNARYIDFTDCTFRKLGITGLQMFDAIQDCNVIGNEFYEIGGSAYSLGQTGDSTNWVEHINPVEYKYYIINNKFNNNFVHEVATECGAAAAISASFPKNTEIKNNDIGNVIYSGMHIGWGWAEYQYLKTATYDLDICDNYVYEVMTDKIYDGGAIYTIGYTSGTKDNPNLIKGNFLQTQRNAASYIYTDEGTTNWSIEGNVIDNSRVDYWDIDGEKRHTMRYIKFYRASIFDNVAKNNYTNIGNIQFVEGNEYYDNTVIKKGEPWPADAQKIIDASGLQGEYEKRYSDGIRYIRSVRNMFIAQDEIQKMPINAYGRKYAQYDVPDGVYYVSSRPDIAQVDEFGNVTAKGSGTAEISAYLKVDDQILTTRTEVICGGEIEKISLGRDTFTLVEGYDVNIAPEVHTSLGERRYLTADYKVADNDIINIDDASGIITALAPGETTITVKYNYGAQAIEKTYTVTVLPASNPDALNYEFVKPDNAFFEASNWSAHAKASGKSLVFKTPSSYAMSKTMYSGLLNFNINIDETSASGWPAVAFSADGGSHSNGDIYMIGFKNDIVEVQRFNKGVRSVIFGTVLDSYLAGSGIPKKVAGYEYKKTHNITVGVIPEENGARLVLNIDGKNVMDYVDTEPGALIQESFYPIIYARTGTITLSPAN